MLDQLRNLSNPPGAFGAHQGAALGMAVVSTLLMFAGPFLWAVVYLLNERSGRTMTQPQNIRAIDVARDRDHIKAA
jgi:hypothetical protein